MQHYPLQTSARYTAALFVVIVQKRSYKSSYGKGMQVEWKWNGVELETNDLVNQWRADLTRLNKMILFSKRKKIW